MDVLKAIDARRSIRRFKSEPLPHHVVNTILHAATQAPSGKNRQPWRFIVVEGRKCADMVRVMRSGIEKLKGRGENISSSELTVKVMEQAPVTIFIFDTNGISPWLDRSVERTFMDVVDIQSIGASIQNMALAAQDLGVGSLWICDIFYAYEELREWLGEEEQMIAAISFGYADESPMPRPRKAIDEVARWI